MAHLGLVACVSKKLPYAAEAKELYVSALFTKARKFIEQRCDYWFILSAKYGLLEPTEVVEPYEETLNKKSRRERKEWAEQVWSALRHKLQPGDRVTILAGAKYREFLVTQILDYGCSVEVPMQGLTIGRQLRWLSEQIN